MSTTSILLSITTVIAIVFCILWYKERQAIFALKQKYKDRLKTIQQAHQVQIDNSNQIIRNLIRNQRIQSEHHRSLAAIIADFQSYYEQQSLGRWLAQMRHARFISEIDIGAKLVYPLLKFLGYADDSIELRAPIRLQLNLSEFTVFIDWAIHRNRTSTKTNLFIVKVIAPDQEIEDHLLRQARSFAYGAGTAKYVVTNGTKFYIFNYAIDRDTVAVDCFVSDLDLNWQGIFAELNPQSFSIP